jgi:hypothetical protein
MSRANEQKQREYPDEETRRRWQQEARRSTLVVPAAAANQSVGSNAAYMYATMNQQHPQGHLAGRPQNMYAYQHGPPYPNDQMMFAEAMHHQWACNAMNLSIPPIPKGAYADMSGGGYAPAHTVVLRKRRRDSSVDYTEPTSDADEPTSSLSTAGPKPRRSKKKSASNSKKTGKRFAWPEDLHRDFVTAIFATGLKQ